MNEKLKEICTQIANIEQDICDGKNQYYCKTMETIYKYGMPADALDDVLAIIGFDVDDGKEIADKQLKRFLAGLKRIQKGYSIHLEEQIAIIEKMIEEKQSNI